jgi:ribosomal protein S27E
MKKVTKHTRAKKDGTILRCPKCGSTEGNRIYHFSWSAVTCQSCREMVYKEEWGIPSGQELEEIRGA